MTVFQEDFTGKKFIWGDRIDNESAFFNQKKDLINDSNTRLFNTFSLISFIFLFSFFLISLIPPVQAKTDLANGTHRLIYLISSLVSFGFLLSSVLT